MPLTFDADQVIATLNARAGTGLVQIGTAEHGQTGGAVYVRWPDGHEGVLTRSRATVADLERTAEVLTLARSQGLPVPRYELIMEFGDGIAVLQERLPGSTVNRIDHAHLDAMLAMNERFAGVLAGRDDIPVRDLQLQDPEWHTVLAAYSDRSRQVLAAIEELGEHRMTGNDLLHLDFHAENVLFDDTATITGVVDWDGSAARGDRRFSLIKFRFELEWGSLYPPAPDRTVVARLDDYLDATLPPDLMGIYWAHWSLRMLNWTIAGLQAPEADIELHLDLALSRLRS